MSVDVVIKELDSWLVNQCNLLIDDSKHIAVILVRDHQITSLISLQDVLKHTPAFLTNHGVPLAYDLQIKRCLRRLYYRDLDSLSALEVSIVFRNMSYSPAFWTGILQCGISGFILSIFPAEEILKLLHAVQESVKVLHVVIQTFKSDGVPIHLLNMPSDPVPTYTTPVEGASELDKSNRLQIPPETAAMAELHEIINMISNTCDEVEAITATSPLKQHNNVVTKVVSESQLQQTDPQTEDISAMTAHTSKKSTTRECTSTIDTSQGCPVQVASQDIHLSTQGSLTISTATTATKAVNRNGDNDGTSAPTSTAAKHAPKTIAGSYKQANSSVPRDTKNRHSVKVIDAIHHAKPIALSTATIAEQSTAQTKLTTTIPQLVAVAVNNPAYTSHLDEALPPVKRKRSAKSTLLEASGGIATTLTKKGSKQITTEPSPALLSKRVRTNASVHNNASSQDIEINEATNQLCIKTMTQIATQLMSDITKTQRSALVELTRQFVFHKISVQHLQQSIDTGMIRRIFDLANTTSTHQDIVSLCILALKFYIGNSQIPTIRDMVFNFGASQMLIDKLRTSSLNLELTENAIGMMSDYVCTAAYREVLLADGLIDALIQSFDEATYPQSRRNKIIQTVYNLVRASPHDVTKPLLPLIAQSISFSDSRCATDALACLHVITVSQTVESIQSLFDIPGLVEKVVMLTSSDSINVCTAAERVIENMSAGTVEHAKTLVGLGILTNVHTQLHNNLRNQRKRKVTAVQIALNLCSADEEIIDAVFQANIFQSLMSLFPYEKEDVVCSVLRTICASIDGASVAQTASLISIEILPLMCKYLQEYNGIEATVEILNAFVTIFTKCTSIDQFDNVVRIIYEHDGWIEVDALRHSENQDVQTAACNVNIERQRMDFLQSLENADSP